ncbi:MAG: head-tail connector protein [Planctomycetota bacterium]
MRTHPPTLEQTVAPEARPCTVEELLQNLKQDDRSDDTLAECLRHLDAAIAECQRITYRQLITATYEFQLRGFEAIEIPLPRPPLQGVTTIHYLDTGNAWQLLSTSVYEVDTKGTPGVVRLKYGQTWPSTLGHARDVKIKFTAGYGDEPEDVPAALRQAILALASYFYENPLTTSSEPEGPPLAPWATQQVFRAYRAHGCLPIWEH